MGGELDVDVENAIKDEAYQDSMRPTSPVSQLCLSAEKAMRSHETV